MLEVKVVQVGNRDFCCKDIFQHIDFLDIYWYRGLFLLYAFPVMHKKIEKTVNVKCDCDP